MNKASNFSISTRQKVISLLLGLVVGFLVINVTKLLLDNDEPSTCSSVLIAQGYTCITPSGSMKDPSKDPCATGAASMGFCESDVRPTNAPEAYPGAGDDVNTSKVTPPK